MEVNWVNWVNPHFEVSTYHNESRTSIIQEADYSDPANFICCDCHETLQNVYAFAIHDNGKKTMYIV